MARMPNLERQGEAFNRLGVSLYELLGEGDDRIVMQVRAAGGAMEADIKLFSADGSHQSPEGRYDLVSLPAGVAAAAREHRATCYTPGKGTWFTLTMTVTAAGGADADMDYDHEPQWASPVEPAEYAADVARFPIEESIRPQWLRERLAAAPPGSPTKTGGLRGLFGRRKA